MKLSKNALKMNTQTQVNAVTSLVKSIGDTIKEAGCVPSGHLYTILQGFGCTIGQFESLIEAFVKANKVKQVGQLLYWIG